MTLPGENGNRPVFAFITKDLAEVFTDAQTEAVLVCAVTKHGGTYSLWADTRGEEELVCYEGN